MIVNNQVSGTVDNSGVLANKAFSVKMGGKAFKLLSDTLYTNKIGSIVRELACNAVDSHNAAGKSDVKFDIHLPTVYEPTFYVRDYGLGMSKEMIENTYTTYFESTKDSSNDSIGGMGLGGKTPFSYTKSFTIVSIWNGRKYFYSAMLDENDAPSISLFGEEDTDECNGVMIEFNVERGDFYRFADEVYSQLMFFDNKPNVINDNGRSFKNIEYYHDFGNFKVPSNHNGMYIVQGGVGYRINRNEFDDKISDKSLLEFFNLYSNIIMFFNIGEIEVTISREGISYSKHTINAIENFVKNYTPIIVKSITDKLENMSDDIERMRYLNSDSSARRFMKLANLTLGISGNFGDKKLNIENGDFSRNYYISIAHIFDNNGDKIKDMSISIQYANSKRSWINSVNYSGSHLFNPRHKNIVIIRDIGMGAISRLNYYRENNGSDLNIIFIEHTLGANQVNQAFIDRVKDLFDGFTIMLSSQMDEVPKTERKNRPVVVYENPTSKYLSTGSFSNWDRIYDEEEIEGGIYAVYETYPQSPLNSNVEDLLDKMIRAGWVNKSVYFIKDKKAKILKDNPNFETIESFINKILDDKKANILQSKHLINRLNNAKFVLNSNMVDHNLSNIADFIAENSYKDGIIPKNLRISKAKRMVRIATRVRDNILEKISSEIEREILDKSTENMNISDIVNRMVDANVVDQKYLEKYPLLYFLNNSSEFRYSWNNNYTKDNKVKILMDYINMVDNQNT